MNLKNILTRSEGKTLEFKRDLSSPTGILKTIVAFANTAGGTIVIGVEDKTKNIKGIDNPLQLEERLANLISDCIEPTIVPEIEIALWRDNHLIMVEVYPSSIRPHYLKKLGKENGTLVRVGSTNRKADSSLINEMRRVVNNESFDEQPLPKLSSEVVDFRVASECFKHIKQLKRSDLESLGLITKHQNRKVPTIGGLLLFSTEKEKIFPDAWIQAGRFHGLDKKTIIDSVVINTYLIDSLSLGMQFVEKHAMQTINIKQLQHSRQWNIPYVAIREALINAIVHADYSQQGAPIRIAIFDDRIEIESPGLLMFGLTISDIKQGVSKLRNRVIGKVFSRLGYIEQWGSGIRRITSTCREGGYDLPRFEEIGTHFRVTIPTIRKVAAETDDLDKKIVHLLSKSDGLSTSKIASEIELSTRATRTRLIKLVEKGIIVEIGLSKRDPNRKYYMAENSL